MRWIKIEESLPPETKDNEYNLDVWANGGRTVEVKYKDNKFYEQFYDDEGYYSHEMVIENVTHWLLIEEPNEE